MSHLGGRYGRHLSSSLALVGGLTLEAAAVTSCAESDPDTAPIVNVDGGVAHDASSDVTPQEGACDTVDWCPVRTNQPVDPPLGAVWGSGRNDVVAVGAAGSVVHWDGSAWTASTVATEGTLYAVWGSGANDIWTVSSAKTIFRTTGFAGGTAQWSPVTAVWDDPLVQSFDKNRRENFVGTIWGTSPMDIWIGGDFLPIQRQEYALESGWRSVIVDGNVRWTPVFEGPDSTDQWNIRSMWGSSSEDVWAVGTKGRPQMPFVAHTHGVAAADGGVPEWTELDMQSFSIMYAIWGTGPGDVWAVGDHGTIRHFTAGAESFSVVDSPTDEDLRAIWGAGANDIWAVGEHGALLHYDGTEWSPSTAAFPDGEKPNLYGVWGSDSDDVWAVGGGGILHFSGPKSQKGDRP